MENSVARLSNKVVHNRANSSGEGPAHIENTEKKQNLISLAGSSPDSSGTGIVRQERCQLIGTKLNIKTPENRWTSPSTSLSATGPTHLESSQLI